MLLNSSLEVLLQIISISSSSITEHNSPEASPSRDDEDTSSPETRRLESKSQVKAATTPPKWKQGKATSRVAQEGRTPTESCRETKEVQQRARKRRPKKQLPIDARKQQQGLRATVQDELSSQKDESTSSYRPRPHHSFERLPTSYVAYGRSP